MNWKKIIARAYLICFGAGCVGFFVYCMGWLAVGIPILICLLAFSLAWAQENV